MDDERGRDCQQTDTMKANDFEARILEDYEYSLWNELAVQSPQGSIFHNSDYLRMVADASSRKINIYGCFKDDELVGGCPLFVKRSRGGNSAISKGPNTPYAGFLLPDQDSTNVRKSELVQHGILNTLCDRIQRDRYSSITITNSPDLLDIRPCLWRGWEGRVAYTYYVNLEGNFFERFSKGVRREVRKAVDAGIYVEKLGDAAIHHKLLTQVFGRQELDAPADKNFFTNMLDFIERKKCGSMWVARDEPGNVLASRIWIWDNKRAYAWSAASNQTSRDSGANQFLFVKLLEEIQRMGFHQVNMMHANTQRLSYHATGYNPVLVPYYSITKRGVISSIAVSIIARIKGRR